MNSTPPSPLQNHLLAQLPVDEQQRWLQHLEFVNMPLGEVLYESGATLTHVFFPTTAIISLLYVMENGSSAEIAVVGNDCVPKRSRSNSTRLKKDPMSRSPRQQ